jgi:hypothetical protein
MPTPVRVVSVNPAAGNQLQAFLEDLHRGAMTNPEPIPTPQRAEYVVGPSVQQGKMFSLRESISLLQLIFPFFLS